MSFLDPLYNFFGAILAFFYGLVPNLGIAIILLTVSVMLVLFPLTAKQAKAMLNMQRAQPQIKAIQAKYKNDKAKQNEEVMKFYQENKINPLAGCLPLLVQMPIFLSLFHLMRSPYKYIPTSSDLYAAFCTNPAGKVVSETACSKPPLPTHLSFLGMDLSLSAIGAHDGFLSALPYFLLVGLVIVTGFLQARQSKRNAPNMNSQMAMVTQILPIGFGLFSLQFPSGLVLYYFVSNLWRLGQQELIMRKITRPGMAALNATKGDGDGAIDVKGKEKDPKPGGAATATLDTPEPKGLRKLFRPALPAASSETAGNGGSTNGGANGANGAAKPPATTPASRGGSSGGGGARGRSQSTPATPGGQRRKNNKRKKKR